VIFIGRAVLARVGEREREGRRDDKKSVAHSWGKQISKQRREKRGSVIPTILWKKTAKEKLLIRGGGHEEALTETPRE